MYQAKYRKDCENTHINTHKDIKTANIDYLDR